MPGEQPKVNPDHLIKYLSDIYPYDLLFRWLSPDPAWFPHREIAFFTTKSNNETIAQRYKSFTNGETWRQTILSQIRSHGAPPSRFEFGALYNINLAHKKMANVFPIAREFVIDIDTDDYDAVRTCCSGSSYCQGCFPLLTTAAQICSEILSFCFDLHHVIWVYSGRRGLHGWVCDNKSRKMNNLTRSRIAKFLSLAASRSPGAMFSQLPQRKLLEFTDRLINQNDVNMGLLTALYNARQDDIFGVDSEENEKIWRTFLNNIKGSHGILVSQIESSIARARESAYFNSTELKAIFHQHLPETLLLELVWWTVGPRLDVNVSAQMNHLLKAPFCIHPGTGFVCVPLSRERICDFYPEPDNYEVNLKNVVEDPSILDPYFNFMEQFIKEVKNS
ncbi:hypothetical protein P9112_011600 [Eukaryota sp. TZLM1-RC]